MLCRWVLSLVCVALFSASVRAGDARPVNVVVMVADDLGQRDLGCYGSTFYETPALDRLAAGGIRLTRAYSACPVCSPTRCTDHRAISAAQRNYGLHRGSSTRGMETQYSASAGCL